MADPDGKDRGDDTAGDEIKVRDRRLFTREGVLRDELIETETTEEGETRDEARGETPTGESGAGSVEEGSVKREEPGFQHRPVEEPEGVDFMMLINAMAQPALIFLGEAAHPGTGKPEVDLEQARLQIDLLDVLCVKCRGNMTPQEEGLLDRLLYQLRMLYVARSGMASGQ